MAEENMWQFISFMVDLREQQRAILAKKSKKENPTIFRCFFGKTLHSTLAILTFPDRDLKACLRK